MRYLLPLLLYLPTVSQAAEVKLAVRGAARSWVAPQPFVTTEWSGNTLYVRTSAIEIGSYKIDRSRASVILSGDNFRLCYNLNPVQHDKDHPMLMAAWDVTLEFAITDLPRANYHVAVAHDCTEPS